MKYVEQGEGYSHSVGYEYDNINNLTALVETINGVSRETTYTYDDDNRVTGSATEASGRVFTYDALGRISKWETKHNADTVLTDEFTFAAPTAGNGTTTGQISTHRLLPRVSGSDITHSYTYDDTCPR